MKPTNNKAVLFIDLLGFAALVKKYPVDPDDILAYDRLSHYFGKALTGDENRLSSVIWNFHHSLKWSIELARLNHSITSISFSDSAFLAADRLNEIVELGIGLIQNLLSRGIPVRAGIAYGSFEAFRFKSDISRDSSEHAAHFLGTGVVDAYQAESSGSKGIRILLHPSAEHLLDEGIPVLKLPDAELENPLNRAAVRLEVDYWSFNITNGKRAWHSLQDLWDDAPDDVSIHYQSTAEAVNRMRVRQGFEPLKSLRRRTLPRKPAG